jgi:putative transposase
MPRTARLPCDGQYVHALNRRVDRRTLLHSESDYACLSSILAWAQRELLMELTAWCLMPNHWHLIVRPSCARHLSEFMHCVQTTHAVSFRRDSETRGNGCVYGNRFKAFVIPPDRVLRAAVYVERNAVRASLAPSAEAWRHCSASRSGDGVKFPKVTRLPWELERHRRALLGQPLPESFEAAFRQACQAGDLPPEDPSDRMSVKSMQAWRQLDAARDALERTPRAAVRH